MSHSHSHTHHHGHDHADHGHCHVPTVTGDNERKVLLGFSITFTFMVVEVVGGLMSGSLALIADAGHMLTDAAALALAFAAFRAGKRAADSKRTFGYLRFEVVAGLVNALTLFAIVGWIAYEAFRRFRDPEPVLAGPMLAVAVAGLLVNLLIFRILTRGDSEHVNIRGAVLHVLGDLLGSVGAIVAALVIHFTGWAPIDPLLSLLVSLLILRSAWNLMGQSIHILLEGAPDHASPDEIAHHLEQNVAGLTSVNHVHAWSLTSGRVLATLHVGLTDDASPPAVTREVVRQLEARFGIEHATVAIDWARGGDGACSLSRIADAGARGGHDHEGRAHRCGAHA